MECQMKFCREKARYALYRTWPDGMKVWIHVCGLHEGIIGQENLQRKEEINERRI